MTAHPQRMTNQQPPQANPLKAHFRQPAAFVKLPSNGAFWPPGSIDIPPDGNIPVYPMTVQNEITLKMPDALLTGAAMVEVIQSCCPNIKNAWQMPSIDVDAILITIRIASYGDTMSVDTNCPECSKENTYGIPLYNIVNAITPGDYETTHEVGGLIFKFKPQDYKTISDINNTNFAETRMMQGIQDSKDEDEKQKHIEKHLRTLVNLNLSILANSTESISIPDGEVVVDHRQILEFYTNADMNVVRAVQNIVTELSVSSKTPDQNFSCDGCGHKYSSPIEFDYANFFD